jgi:hypothetical protein
MAEKSSAARFESLYIVFLFHLGRNVAQSQITFTTAFPGSNSISQSRNLMLLMFKQP